jgi:TRAP transporter TAXI family solute receptor
MPRFPGCLAVLAAWLVLTAAAPEPAIGGAEDIRLILATATTGGTYYPVGVGIATLATTGLEKSRGISMTAISSAGSGENLQLLKNREADLAIIQSLFGVMAREGRGRYRGSPQPYLSSLTILWDNVEHFVVRKRYIRTGDMSDMTGLRDRNFSIGSRGSGTEMSGRVILEALGFDPRKDFKLKYLGYTPSAQALQNGRIAGMNIPAGPPAGAVTQAIAAMGADEVRILEFTDAQLDRVNAAYPVWRRAVLRAGTYPGQDLDLSTISQPNLLVAHQDLAEEVVFALLENLYDNLASLRRIHQATAALRIDNAITGLSVPLHPGAVRFYESRGVHVPDHLR